MVKVSNDVLAKINESQNVLVTRVENMATNMDKVTENLTKSSTGMFKEITDIVKSLINEIEGSMKSVKQIAGEVESTMKAVSNGHNVLDDATKALKATIDEVQKYQSDYINRMVEISTRVERVSRLTSMSASKMVEHFQKYKEEFQAKHVQILFITRELPVMDQLIAQGKKVDEITNAFDHILKNIILDCDLCPLHPICDDVEELRQIHFARK